MKEVQTAKMIKQFTFDLHQAFQALNDAWANADMRDTETFENILNPACPFDKCFNDLTDEVRQWMIDANHRAELIINPPKAETPPKGYYRQLLSDKNIRIAFTHTPIIGCTKVDNTKVLEELKASGDPHAKFYIDKLGNGELVTIVENQNLSGDRYFRSGELYFTT